MTKTAFALEAHDLVEQIKPLLAGRNPTLLGAVLADLVSMWLAGHFGSAGLREELLRLHIQQVRDLIPVNEQIILEHLEKH
jgi:hypothetical protein